MKKKLRDVRIYPLYARYISAVEHPLKKIHLQSLSVLPAKVRGDNKTLYARYPSGKRAMVRRYRLCGPPGPRSYLVWDIGAKRLAIAQLGHVGKNIPIITTDEQ
eukprot:scaffold10546_cov114-Isochrysis_galbana.AAC.1